MNKQLTLHSEFVDKFDREISVKYTYISFFSTGYTFMAN
jgi:hypothetical protein